MILKINNLCKYFFGLKAIDGITFDVPDKNIFAIIGPNGAGKTTFFNVLSGIYAPTIGEIIFKDKNIVGMRPDEIAHLGISRTFQNLRLFPHMTVIENILSGTFARTKYSLKDTIFRTKRFKKYEEKNLTHASHVAKLAGIIGKDNELAKNLSYGEQKKLEIARALAAKPTLLLLDEPAAGMNPKETKEIIFLIKTINNMGITIILIEHDMKLVMNISSRIVVLDYGVKLAEGTPDEIRANTLVIEAYLGKASHA